MTELEDLQKALKSKAKKCSGMTTEEIFSGLWLSVETVTALLQKFVAEKTVAEEKNVEYAKLVAGQAKEYAEKMATVQAKELSLRKELETWMIAKGKRLYEIETMLQQMEIEWQGQERNSEDFQELWIRGSDLLKKLFDETFPLEQAKVSVDRKQLSELFETKRKEWKIAYPLKSQEDFNYRVLIDEIFDELVKELLAGFVGVEPENKKKEP